MLHLPAETVHRLLDYPGLIGALRKAHEAGRMPIAKTEIVSDGNGNDFVSMIAWSPGEVISVKLVGIFPANPSLPVPQPSSQGVVSLFDGNTGSLLLSCDGAAETFRKTAADSGLGSCFLARADARVLVVVGAGGLAPHVVAAHRAARPSLERVFIWNRNFGRAEVTAANLADIGVPVTAAKDLNSVLPEADIVSCVTSATEPLVKGALLKAGVHVDLVGAYTPAMREADDDVARRAGVVFVDTRYRSEKSGDVLQPLSRGLVSGIAADLFDLATGHHPGRTDDTQITMYKNVGGAPHLDLFTMRHLFSLSQGAGTARSSGVT
jgi:ornithine cyclodeaminase/alanine dehydrogenase-like protein (mu-crystallin family)